MLWVRSHFASDSLSAYWITKATSPPHLRHASLIVATGELELYYGSGVTRTSSGSACASWPQAPWPIQWQSGPAVPHLIFPGQFRCASGTSWFVMGIPVTGCATIIDLPIWFLALLAALLSATAAGLRLRLRRRPPGLCPTCGYDLRATPEAGGPLLDRCPECGAKRPHQRQAVRMRRCAGGSSTSSPRSRWYCVWR